MLSGRDMSCRSVIIQRQSPLLKLLPVDVVRSFALLHHGNTAVDGADQLAEVAAYAFFLFNRVSIVRITSDYADGLV